MASTTKNLPILNIIFLNYTHLCSSLWPWPHKCRTSACE